MNPKEILQLQSVTVLVLVDLSTDGHSFAFAFKFALASRQSRMVHQRPILEVLLPQPIFHALSVSHPSNACPLSTLQLAPSVPISPTPCLV